MLMPDDELAAAFARARRGDARRERRPADAAAHLGRVARRAASRRRRSRCAARRATTSRSTSRSRRRPPGRVLVVDVGDERRARLLGRGAHDRPRRRAGSPGSSSTAACATSTRWTRTASRCSRALIALPGATKTLPGAIGARGRPSATSRCEAGDWIVGDADGVVVVPGDRRRRRARRGPGPRREGGRPVRRAARRQDDGRAARPRPLADHRRLTLERAHEAMARRRWVGCRRRGRWRRARASRASPCGCGSRRDAEPMCGSSTARGAREQPRVRPRARARTRRCPAANSRPACERVGERGLVDDGARARCSPAPRSASSSASRRASIRWCVSGSAAARAATRCRRRASSSSRSAT